MAPTKRNHMPLSVLRLSKRYQLRNGDCVDAVRDVSFEVAAGECFGLLGPNGAGKSSAIRCICGFYPASEGKVYINGYDVFRHPKKARQDLGVCSQEETLDSDFNVFDQLVRHATYFRIPIPIARERAKELLERFSLSDKANEKVENLSGGLRRRLQVARAFISEPRVLVLDEPTTGLDPDIRRMLWEVLAEARTTGAAILLSTHYMDEAERICDRVAILSKGHILDIDSPQSLITRYIAHTVVEEELRPGVIWKRAPNLEDVYLKLTGSRLAVEGL